MQELYTGVKTPEQINAMREGGKILARIFDDVRAYVEPGLSEKEIDSFVRYSGPGKLDSRIVEGLG